jgi:peptidoglycan hydrolase CwlO-like protein
VQIAASSLSAWEGGVALVIGIIGFVVLVAASYTIIKARRSTVLADQQDKANNALQAELSASQATIERVTNQFGQLTAVMQEKQHQLDDKQRQIDGLKADLMQKAAVEEANVKLDLIMRKLEIVAA